MDNEVDHGMVNGHEYKIIHRLTKEGDCYPQTDCYTFQEFAGFVIEYGGYGDVTLINPSTGMALWLAQEFESGSPDLIERSISEQLHILIDVAEEAGFFE